jgi:hypothetical protein
VIRESRFDLEAHTFVPGSCRHFIAASLQEATMSNPADIGCGTTTRSRQIASYAAGARDHEFPGEVSKAAIAALVDYVGVEVGAANDAPVRPVRRVAESWAARGNARILLGPLTAPALAA